MTNKEIKSGGYTLIEMVIAITVLMIFVGILSGSYANLVRANQNANDSQKIYHAARFIFDELADEIRHGRIDYTCVDIDPENPDALCIGNTGVRSQRIIALLSEDGLTRTLIRFEDLALEMARYARLTVKKGWVPAMNWQRLNPVEFPLQEGAFSVFPLKDPYDPGNADINEVQFQPSIKISIKFKNITFETTYSSRAYGTRVIYSAVDRKPKFQQLFNPF